MTLLAQAECLTAAIVGVGRTAEILTHTAVETSNRDISTYLLRINLK